MKVTKKKETKKYKELTIEIPKEELKATFESPRGFYNSLKEIHKLLGVPWLDEKETLEWVEACEKTKCPIHHGFCEDCEYWYAEVSECWYYEETRKKVKDEIL